MAEHNPPLWLQNRTDHTAENERSLVRGVFTREGVVSATSMSVTQNGTPNMSVNVSAGHAVIQGDESANQGFYLVWNDAVTNLVISAADATNPRRDLIVARVKDTYYSGATDAFELAVVQGTPAGSPADPTTPDNAIVLARVAVAALASSITNANITDLRPRAAARGGVIVCTSTTRPSVPTAGDLIYETDTKKLLEYQDSTLEWTLPWNMPWGYMGISSITSNSSAFTATADILSLSLTSVAPNRRIKLTAFARTSQSGSGASANNILITDGSNNGLISTSETTSGSSFATTHVPFVVTTSGSGGSLTFKIRGAAGVSTVVAATVSAPAFLVAEDVGPA